MAYLQFPDIQYFIALESSGSDSDLGRFNIAEENFALAHMQLTLQKVGAHGGSERFRLIVYSTSTLDNAIATSEWVSVGDIESLTSSAWAGYVTFDFPRTILDDQQDYWVILETENYTRNGDIYYWGAALDWPDDINTAAVSGERAGQFAILGYTTRVDE